MRRQRKTKAWHDLLEGVRALPHEKPRIFISYAWEKHAEEIAKQQRWLKDLEQDLEAMGMSVFLDVLDMNDDMNEKMRSGITNSDAAIIICTPMLKARAQSETNIAFEIHNILERKLELPASFQILPLLYSGKFAESVPAELGHFLVRDCVDKSKYVDQMVRLDTPSGIVPGLLGIRRGHSAYSALLTRYRLTCATNLPTANPRFCGREAALLELEQGFSSPSGQVQVISGLGGAGKTQLALAYAHQHSASFQICRWILSEGAQLSLSIRRFAGELGIDIQGLDEEEIVTSLYEAIWDCSWLLVFDNVDDAACFRGYLPQGALKAQQNILVTSRSRCWERKMTLREFSAEEALMYLRSQVSDVDGALLARLAEVLSYLPLALSQAVAYIRASGVHIKTYLGLLDDHLLCALNEPDLEESYHSTIQGTWALSKKRIQEHPDALRLLNACAWLGADEIPIYLLANASLLRDPATVVDALKILNTYSMVEEIRPGYLKIHRLVQLVLREDNDALPLLESVCEALYRFYPFHKTTHDDITHTRELIEHLTAVRGHDEQKMQARPNEYQEHYLNMTDCLGDAYRALGNPQKTVDLLERTLGIKEQHYGREHYKVARTLGNLGSAYGDLDNPEKAKDLLERALVMREEIYGSDHFKVSITLTNLGIAYQALGNPEKARDVLERALGVKEKHYGPEHFKVAKTLGNLGNAYGALGNPEKQRDLQERALWIEENHYGREHYEVAKTLGNLGNAYGALGDPDKQRDLLERALGIEERHYGPEHYEVARTLTNLGNAYGHLGNPEKQKDLLERALGIKEKHYGSDHYEVSIVLTSLADAFGALGDPEKQNELLQRALRITEKHTGSKYC